jgi:hypothetical protein
MPAHTPGQPADATTTGFDWTHPLNRAEVDRLRPVLDVLTRVRKIAATEDASAVDGRQVLEVALSRGLDRLAHLPPFPLPGDLADLTLADLTVFMAFWKANLQWMTAEQTVVVEFPAPPVGPGPVPVTASPLAVFRRVMAGSGG